MTLDQPASGGCAGVDLSKPKNLEEKPLRYVTPVAGKTERVARWQRILRCKGWYGGPISGRYTLATLNATRTAARANKVGFVGVITPGLWDAVAQGKVADKPPRIVDARNGKAGFAIHPSKTWGFRPISSILGFCGHYTGGHASFQAYSAMHVFGTRLSSTGAPALAYHLAIDFDGTLFVVNDPTDRTWHAGPANSRWIGLNFNGSSEGMTPAQYEAMDWLLEHGPKGALAPFGWPADAFPKVMSSHRHFTPTACPGDRGEAQYKALAAKHGYRFDPNPST